MARFARYLVVLLLALLCVISWTLPPIRHARASSSGTFTQYTYNGAAGSRPYYVYTPANYQVGTAVPMVVMLHGCTQTPTDFAAGIQMNALADQQQSGLEYQAATSQTAASTAQSQGGPSPTQQGQAAYNAMGSVARVVPTIDFQGQSDYTVYPVNGDQSMGWWFHGWLYHYEYGNDGDQWLDVTLLVCQRPDDSPGLERELLASRERSNGHQSFV
jgi:Poly(3-hydroxybutyrate) depolymerase